MNAYGELATVQNDERVCLGSERPIPALRLFLWLESWVDGEPGPKRPSIIDINAATQQSQSDPTADVYALFCLVRS